MKSKTDGFVEVNTELVLFVLRLFKVRVSNGSLFIQKTDILTAIAIHPIDPLSLRIFGFHMLKIKQCVSTNGSVHRVCTKQTVLCDTDFFARHSCPESRKEVLNYLALWSVRHVCSRAFAMYLLCSCCWSPDAPPFEGVSECG